MQINEVTEVSDDWGLRAGWVVAGARGGSTAKGRGLLIALPKFIEIAILPM